MDREMLFWAIVVAVVNAAWILAAFLRNRKAQSIEYGNAMMARLLDNDKLVVEHPEIQKYLSQNAMQNEQYFCSEACLGDLLFFKAKALAYGRLNAFDGMLSASAMTTRHLSFLKPSTGIELDDWKAYLVVMLRHPLYRSILKREGEIFGKQLRKFWDKHRGSIESTPVDPFVW